MSIFKETFRDFVFEQLRIREAIMKKGNAGDSRFASIEDFSPRTEIKGKDGKSKKITIDAGAFYTNTTSKQCVIRMCSGVDIKDDEETIKSILEDTQFEKARDLTGAGLAIRYILEGGVPAKNIDFTKNISKEEGKKEYGRDFSQGISVIPRGRGNRGFGKNYGSTYGDPYLRSDAADGFGIVPMPGIVDADIRTKTAYGSLREAKVNFVCHNRRQLEVLELLYMRPGYPLLLEWGWDPFISNEGKRESYFPYLNEWFEEESSINQINAEIVRRKKVAGGNYDGFVGFVKNFEITSRDDGGYNCSTELVAMGEVLEGLKGRRDGLLLPDDNGENVREVDNLEFYLNGLKEFNDYIYGLETGDLVGAETEIGKTVTTGNSGESTSTTTFIDTALLDKINSLDAIRDIFNTLSKAPLSTPDPTEEETQEFGELADIIAGLSPQEEIDRYQKLLDQYFIRKGQMISTNYSDFESNTHYVRWDLLTHIFNKFVFNIYKEKDENKEKQINSSPITELTVLRDSISKETITPEYLEYSIFSFENSEIDPHFSTTDILGREQNINIETLVDTSIDPSVCLLPHQIKSVDKKDISSTTTDPIISNNRSIGKIYLNIKHLIKIYDSLRYNKEGTNDDFNLFDFIKKIWEDVNKACANTHNFILQTEHERPNVSRIIDLIAQNQIPDLFEFKIQSNVSIVRDFNYNTTVPSSLSATIAVAAQSPTSLDGLDAVTFARFNKYTNYRFSNIENTVNTIGTTDDQKKKAGKRYDTEKEKLHNIIQKLVDYQINIDKTKDENTEETNIISKNTASGYIKSLENILLSLSSKYATTDINGKYYKGEIRKNFKSPKSAVIPLKFNAQLDGISGIVIGNVFKVEKNKLPKGYQADDIAFVVMGESQKITSGQDWTTEINGQLMLLDLPEETTTQPNTTQETSTEEKTQLDGLN